MVDRSNLSPNYLSDLLGLHPGRNTGNFIQDKLSEKARDLLFTTRFLVTEIAFQLGFEYPQSFSRLFKTKRDAPLEFTKIVQ
ncbi:helix-turn-helix domain-containing protein [Algoriphagus sp. Y33]|uniref:helix-turn-helix domain-containing protein n=1 Tax=Algoriphagus sp. Y33 TaxID=2772483 RepID=UPI001786EE04